MSQNRIKEVTVDVAVGHKGHFTAEWAINGAGFVVTDPVVYEFDRKRLYEDNGAFDIVIEDRDGIEHVVYQRTSGPESSPLSVIIYIHYK